MKTKMPGREAERQELLARLQEKAFQGFEKVLRREQYPAAEMRDLQYVFLVLLSRQIAGYFWEGGNIDTNNIPEAGMRVKKGIAQLFFEIQAEVLRFQASEEEGATLFTELLRWTAGRIACQRFSPSHTETVLAE